MATIEKVNYEKIFPLAPYINEKIGVSYILDENDDPVAVLQAAKDLCEEFHKKSMSASLEHQHQSLPPEPSVLPSIQVEKLEVREQTLEEQIQSCTEIKVLESYKFIAKKDPALQEIFDKTMQELKSTNQ